MALLPGWCFLPGRWVSPRHHGCISAHFDGDGLTWWRGAACGVHHVVFRATGSEGELVHKQPTHHPLQHVRRHGVPIKYA